MFDFNVYFNQFLITIGLGGKYLQKKNLGEYLTLSVIWRPLLENNVTTWKQTKHLIWQIKIRKLCSVFRNTENLGFSLKSKPPVLPSPHIYLWFRQTYFSLWPSSICIYSPQVGATSSRLLIDLPNRKKKPPKRMEFPAWFHCVAVNKRWFENVWLNKLWLMGRCRWSPTVSVSPVSPVSAIAPGKWRHMTLFMSELDVTSNSFCFINRSAELDTTVSDLLIGPRPALCSAPHLTPPKKLLLMTEWGCVSIRFTEPRWNGGFDSEVGRLVSFYRMK